MGLFQSKKKPDDTSTTDDQQHFFDEYFREELRNHGRWYFEKVISENGALFKQDLDDTIKQVNTELREHIAKRLEESVSEVNSDIKEHITAKLDEQFLQYGKTIQDAQELTLNTLKRNAEVMEEQHKRLTETLEKNAADQQAIMNGIFTENKAWSTSMKEAQAAALDWINRSAEAMQHQHEQLAATLEKDAAAQREMLVATFEQNMAKIIEHYLLGTLGDQFDLKAQLPSIVQQLEANKQAIMDDMKL